MGIDFAETGSVRDYSAEAGTAAFAKEDPMTLEDVEVVINALPTIKKEGYIFLPGTKQNLAIADIVNMWNKSILSHEQDPDSSSASCTSKNEQDANTTWKEQWDSFLQYTDETANPAAFLAAYNGLPKRGKMELLDNAVGKNTLMGYLMEASIVVDLEDLFNKLHMLKSGTIEESDTDSTHNETNDTAELSLVKEINKDKENRRTPQEFGSELFGGDEEDEEEGTSGGRKNEDDDEDSQYMQLRFQKLRVEVEQPAPKTQHAAGHPQIGEQHNEDNEEEQGVEKTKNTTENNNNESNNNNTEKREIEGTRKRTYHHPDDAYTIDQTKDKDGEETLENTTVNEEKLRDAADLDAILRRRLENEKEVDHSIQKETEERRRRETNRAKKEEDERRKEAARAAELQKTQEEEADELAKRQEAAHRTQREKEKKAEEDRIIRIADLQKELEFEIERQAELEEESRKLDALEEEEKRIEEAQKLQKEEEERLQKEAHKLQKLQKETQRLRKEKEEEARKKASEARREKEDRERGTTEKRKRVEKEKRGNGS